MQVTMSMEEYTKLITANAEHVKQLNKMIDKYEKMGITLNEGCDYCKGEERTIMYTADCNSIYIGKNDNNEFCLINSDTYDGNIKRISYCPMCGKKLEVN